MPLDLQSQMAHIHRLLAALECPAWRRPATKPTTCSPHWPDKWRPWAAIACGHQRKDCRQLITDRVKIYNLLKDEFIDAEAVRADRGSAFPSRGLPAVSGATRWTTSPASRESAEDRVRVARRCGSLDAILEHAHEISAKRQRETLVQNRQQALLSRDLARLASDAPLAIDWDASRVGGGNREKSCDYAGSLASGSLRAVLRTGGPRGASELEARIA